MTDVANLKPFPLPLAAAVAVARGVSRLFLRNQIMVQPEVSLRNNRRADLMGINAKGEIILVEIKCARSDLLGDQKWPEYLEFCDRFFWAVPADHCMGRHSCLNGQASSSPTLMTPKSLAPLHSFRSQRRGERLKPNA
jgi:hypothetical protein